jgi:hypothetical protein
VAYFKALSSAFIWKSYGEIITSQEVYGWRKCSVQISRHKELHFSLQLLSETVVQKRRYVIFVGFLPKIGMCQQNFSKPRIYERLSICDMRIGRQADRQTDRCILVLLRSEQSSKTQSRQKDSGRRTRGKFRMRRNCGSLVSAMFICYF